MDNFCQWHKPAKLSYGAWVDFAERQIKAGNRQRYCPVCKHYLFPCEWGEEPKSDWEELADECNKLARKSGMTKERSRELLKEARKILNDIP